VNCPGTRIVPENGGGTNRAGALISSGPRSEVVALMLRGARIAARRGEQVCEVCGKSFRPARSDARTCSPKCRQKKYRRLRKDRSNPGRDDHHDHDGHGDVDHQDRAGLHERV
jgi:hypothetical protein